MRRNVFERLKICWYILTKKEYAFWAYNKPIYRHTGSVCYISNINDKLFLETIQEHLIQILENHDEKEEKNN